MPEQLARRRVLAREQADELVGQLVPARADGETLNQPAIITDPDLGEPVFAYLPLPPGWTERLTDAVLAIDGYTGLGRAGKLRSLSRTFGMAPRRPTMLHDSCRITSLARDMPKIHAELAELSLVLGEMLHLPEYGITASCRNGFVVFFNGYRLVHGVTPLTYIRPAGRPGGKGYRFSIVYYALRGMKDCATFAAELAQGQAKRTEREDNQRAVVRGEKQWRSTP
jgi:hypothetical protein